MLMKVSENKTNETRAFLDDALKLTSAPVITQAFGFFIIPFITRLYPPESFGLAAAYNSIIVIFGALVTFSYNSAIILSKSESEKNNLFVLSTLITICITTISFVTIVFFSGRISKLFDLPNLDIVLWMIPISVLVWGLMQTLKSFNIREGKFANVAISAILNVIVNNGLVIAIGYIFNPYVFIIIYGQLVGGIINTMVLCRYFTYSKIVTILKTVSKEKILFVAKRHKQFALMATPQGLIGRLINEIPTYLLIFYFSSTVLGFYALGMRILKIPMNLISSSISEVFFQREGPRSQINSESLEKTLSILFIVGSYPFIVLGISGEEVTSFVFGSSWSQSGIYLQILSPYIFTTYMTSLSMSVMVILRKQQNNLIFQLANGIIMVICFIIGGIMNNEIIAFILFSITGCISYIIYAIYSFMNIHISIRNIYTDIRPYMILSVGLLSLLMMVKLFHMPFNVIIESNIISLTLYYAYVLYKHEDIKLVFISLFTKRS